VTIGTKRFGAFSVKDATKGEVEAVFSTFNAKDKDCDWTLPGAFENGAEVLISAYGHRTWAGEPPVGKGVIRTTAKDARLVGRFFLDTRAGHDHFVVMRDLGAMQQWSYGYDVEEKGELTPELEQRGVRRVLKKLLVHEISPVLVAAGIGTRTVATKCSGCGGSTENGASCGCRSRSARMTDEQRAAVDVVIAAHIADDADIRAGRPPGVVEVPACYVHGADLAAEALEAACRDLKLTGLRMRYFDPRSRPGLRGFFSALFPDAIWVSAKLRGYDLLKTVGHELKHAQQSANGDPPDEQDAAAYAQRLVRSDQACWPWAVQPHVYG